MNYLPDSFVHWDPNPSLSTTLKSPAHKEGFWNGLVYLSLQSKSCTSLYASISTLESKLQTTDIKFIDQQHFHISISRPFQLSHRYINSFLNNFQTELNNHLVYP